MPDLLVVTPSRGRPQNMERLLEAMSRTCRAYTKLLIGIDSDDQSFERYPKAGVQYLVRDGLQRKVVQWINYLAAEGLDMAPSFSPYLAVGHFGDDCVPWTEGWDERILEALQKTPFAFGNDLSIERRPGALCTHLFMRTETLKALGHFGPPQIQHMWVDLAWMCWGEQAGMTYLDDVAIEHLHFLEHKADYDWSYQQSRQLVDSDLKHLYDYVQRDLNNDLKKIVPDEQRRTITLLDFAAAAHLRGTPIPVPVEYVSALSK